MTRDDREELDRLRLAELARLREPATPVQAPAVAKVSAWPIFIGNLPATITALATLLGVMYGVSTISTKVDGITHELVQSAADTGQAEGELRGEAAGRKNQKADDKASRAPMSKAKPSATRTPAKSFYEFWKSNMQPIDFGPAYPDPVTFATGDTR